MTKKVLSVIVFLSAILFISSCGSRRDKCPKIGQEITSEINLQNA